MNIGDVLTVSFDSGLNDESALCVSRKHGEKNIILKTEWGEQADILYHLLTDQMTKVEVREVTPGQQDTEEPPGQQFKAPKKLYPIVVSELTRLTAEREQALSEYHKARLTAEREQALSKYHKAMQIVKTIERRVTRIEENIIALKDFKNNTQFI